MGAKVSGAGGARAWKTRKREIRGGKRGVEKGGTARESEAVTRHFGDNG